ncbi:MAG: 16S rRNA (uracil(1498)-N(3))-methyltransferase [Deltaproteobacteria bacterium]|nr:16S rRNA (uracil(1498)-N(3))-methyltransferase [Deltaproteobacteria bacterium]
MRQLLVPFGEIVGDRLPVPAEVRHRLDRVLRLAPGTALTLADGAGRRVQVRYHQEFFAVERREPTQPPPAVAVTLAAGLIKGDRWDWLVEKAAELGVDTLVPLACEHSVVRIDPGKAADKQARWQSIAQEAFEQCGRAHLCRVTAPMTVAQFVERCGGELRSQIAAFTCDEAMPALGLQRAVQQALAASQGIRQLVAVVGPEGGLSTTEWQCLDSAGFERVCLSRAVLRAETAGLAAALIVREALEPVLATQE